MAIYSGGGSTQDLGGQYSLSGQNKELPALDTDIVSSNNTDTPFVWGCCVLESLSGIGLPAYDDDAAASGLNAGDLYQTTGSGSAPLNAAGIVMVKQ